MTRDYRKDPQAISRLSAQQRRVTQEGATEPAFRNEYWDNKDAGIYVDIVSGEPLFASTSKYDSHTGWPSFTAPLEPEHIVELSETSDALFGTEVRSMHGDSHLGHVFKDGPSQAGGLRYCMNSAALRFVPAADLESEGYGQYRRLFDATPTGGTAMSGAASGHQKAVLAGGCFWGMQDLLRRQPGVVSTRVGYTGGGTPNPTYRNHGTHAESIEIVFDSARTSYRQILEFFFQIHDPTTRYRQGNDIGASYRSAIFYLDDDQKRVAEDTIADVDASGLWPGKVVTEVVPAEPFWEAEPEHQDYLERYPDGYTCHFVRPGWRLPRRDEAGTPA